MWKVREKVKLRKIPILGLVPFISMREHRRRMTLQREGEEFHVPLNHVREDSRAAAWNVDLKLRRKLLWRCHLGFISFRTVIKAKRAGR